MTIIFSIIDFSSSGSAEMMAQSGAQMDAVHVSHERKCKCKQRKTMCVVTKNLYIAILVLLPPQDPKSGPKYGVTHGNWPGVMCYTS